MNKYRNTRTGLVVRTKGKVTGEDWEPLEELPWKMDSVEETYDDLGQMEEDTADLMQEDETAKDPQTAREEAPARRPRTRRTK